MTKIDGGPAYPLPLAIGQAGDLYHAGAWSSPGMTLRDYFAGQALPQVLATSFAPPGVQVDSNIMAQGAYLLADAMLAERGKP